MPTPGTNLSYAPVTNSQQWTTEPGFIDSFTNQVPTPAVEALKSGLLGGGAGAVGGAMADRNPWFSGMNTGLGSAAGYLLAHTLAKGHADTGMQNTYETMGSLLGGGAGMAGSMLMKDKHKKQLNLPGELQLTAKTAGIEDVLRAVHEQLPAIRLPDSIVGGGVGALGGLGYDYLKKRNGEKYLPTDERRKNTFRRALIGAGVGAAGGNVVGDRTRRYITNNWLPYGYGENKDTLKPHSLKQIWDSAILDKPQFKEVQDYQAGKYDKPYTDSEGLPFGNTKANFAARFELGRREFGVHTDNPNKDIWATQPDGTLSLNPRHANSENLVREFMFPQSGAQKSDLLTNPLDSIARINEYHPDDRPGMMQETNGGQRISVSPHKGAHGLDYLAKVQDQQTYAPRANELKPFPEYLKQKYLYRNPHATMGDVNAYSKGDNIESQFAKRWFLHNILMKQAPWISQRMYFNQMPDHSFQAVPTTASGDLYPGNTVGVMGKDYLGHPTPDFTDSSAFK